MKYDEDSVLRVGSRD